MPVPSLPSCSSCFARQDILDRLRAKVAAGQPIIGGGAGTGISAKMSEAGGIDLLVIYNSGRFRMAGRGSLAGMMPYGDANAIVLDMAREVIPVVAHTPVLAGVCGTDPFRLMKLFLPEIVRAGLFRRAELSDRGTDRRHVPPGSGRDRHGLWPGGRSDRRGPRARSADDALRVRSRRGRGHGAVPAPTF